MIIITAIDAIGLQDLADLSNSMIVIGITRHLQHSLGRLYIPYTSTNLTQLHQHLFQNS